MHDRLTQMLSTQEQRLANKYFFTNNLHSCLCDVPSSLQQITTHDLATKTRASLRQHFPNLASRISVPIKRQITPKKLN